MYLRIMIQRYNIINSKMQKLDPETCQKEIFAPLPAVLLEGWPEFFGREGIGGKGRV